MAVSSREYNEERSYSSLKYRTPQEVCPFSRRRSEPTSELAFQSREITDRPKLVDLLMDEEEFRQKFKGSAVKRAKRRGLLRNVAVALAASDNPEAERALEIACSDPEPIVREHATWALDRIRERKEFQSEESSLASE